MRQSSRTAPTTATLGTLRNAIVVEREHDHGRAVARSRVAAPPPSRCHLAVDAVDERTARMTRSAASSAEKSVVSMTSGRSVVPTRARIDRAAAQSRRSRRAGRPLPPAAAPRTCARCSSSDSASGFLPVPVISARRRRARLTASIQHPRGPATACPRPAKIRDSRRRSVSATAWTKLARRSNHSRNNSSRARRAGSGESVQLIGRAGKMISRRGWEGRRSAAR